MFEVYLVREDGEVRLEILKDHSIGEQGHKIRLIAADGVLLDTNTGTLINAYAEMIFLLFNKFNNLKKEHANLLKEKEYYQDLYEYSQKVIDRLQYRLERRVYIDDIDDAIDGVNDIKRSLENAHEYLANIQNIESSLATIKDLISEKWTKK